jgi:hypothetical protein
MGAVDDVVRDAFFSAIQPAQVATILGALDALEHDRHRRREEVWAHVRAGEYLAYRHPLGQQWEWRLQLLAPTAPTAVLSARSSPAGAADAAVRCHDEMAYTLAIDSHRGCLAYHEFTRAAALSDGESDSRRRWVGGRAFWATR